MQDHQCSPSSLRVYGSQGVYTPTPVTSATSCSVRVEQNGTIRSKNGTPFVLQKPCRELRRNLPLKVSKSRPSGPPFTLLAPFAPVQNPKNQLSNFSEKPANPCSRRKVAVGAAILTARRVNGSEYERLTALKPIGNCLPLTPESAFP
jgi:hypothetical protein